MLKFNEQQFKEYMENLKCEARKEVLETLEGGDFDDTLCNIDQVYNYGCVSGVSGFIYYDETEAFFDKYATEILGLLEEFTGERGGDSIVSIGFNKNNLTWFFVEQTVQTLVNALDCE